MGYKNKKKEERLLMKYQKELDVLIPKPYSKKERTDKINNIFMDLLKLGVDGELTDNFKKQIFEFRDNGTAFHAEMEMHGYSRILIANFVNDKNKDKDNRIDIKFKKIRINDESDDHPINKLNIIQESLFDQV
jgi:hypothetical protein